MAITKLTLSVDKEIIRKAKAYAKKHGISVSKLLENYLKLLIHEEKPSMVKEPRAKYSQLSKLAGIVKLPDDFDYKKELQKAMIEKYMKIK